MATQAYLEAKKRVSNLGTINQVTTAQVRLELPEHVFDAYATQAQAAGKDPEVVMAERLTRCVKQVDDGIHFNNAEKKRLELFVGHSVADATGALQRLEPQVKITVSGVNFAIPADVLKRFVTRIPRGQTVDGYMQKMIIRSLKQFVGLEPY